MSTQPSGSFPIATTVSIRDAGYDEAWLQDQICENPSALKLGDLEVIAKEKPQNKAGRLDILLKDPENDSMYEVEVMLGATDETHIVRTIEYWDNEKRKYPQRQHHAVLVAEAIERRFFNVIHLFSHAIPIIAIQVNMVEVGGQKSLHFSQILNTYEEPEDSFNTIYEEHDDAYWRDFSPWTLEAANVLLEIIKPVFPDAQLHYVKYYISIRSEGDGFFWFHKRSEDKSLLNMWFSEKILPQAAELLDTAEISYLKKEDVLRLTINPKTLRNHADIMRKIGELAKLALKEQ